MLRIIDKFLQSKQLDRAGSYLKRQGFQFGSQLSQLFSHSVALICPFDHECGLPLPFLLVQFFFLGVDEEFDSSSFFDFCLMLDRRTIQN